MLKTSKIHLMHNPDSQEILFMIYSHSLNFIYISNCKSFLTNMYGLFGVRFGGFI